ncbi:hypothetical protein AK812_SmicGene44315, partial [Symbiodinium microadriaticum]
MPPAAVRHDDPSPFEAPRPPPGPPPPLVRTSYILVCRSALGRVNYNDEQRPDPDKLVKSCTDGHFQSVLGDRLKLNKTFREIIVYNDDHVYPELIVKYERIFFHERFAAVYKAMLQRSIAGRFTGPTKEELDVLQSMWQVYSMPNKDPALGVCDLKKCMEGLLEKAQVQKKLKLFEFVSTPAQKDFVDFVGDKIRMCLGHLRHVKLSQIARQRLFKKTEQTAILQLLSLIYLPPDAGEVVEEHLFDAGKISKSQLLDLLLAIYQPPDNEDDDLDQTFKEWDKKGNGKIDWDDFLSE